MHICNEITSMQLARLPLVTSNLRSLLRTSSPLLFKNRPSLISKTSTQRGIRAMSSTQADIVWYRGTDLRVTDHAPLTTATAELSSTIDGVNNQSTTLVVPIYCLDDASLLPRSSDPLGLPSMGPYKLRALLQALTSLQRSLKELGGDLVTCSGSTTQALSHLTTILASLSSSVTLHYYLGVGQAAVQQEEEVEKAVKEAAAAAGVAIAVVRHFGATTYHPQDISFIETQQNHPTPNNGPEDNNNDDGENGGGVRWNACFANVAHSMPTIMSDFRRALQTSTPVRQPGPAPKALPPLPFALQCNTTTSTGSSIANDRVLSLERGALPLGEVVDLREVYRAAGAQQAVEALEELVQLPNSVFTVDLGSKAGAAQGDGGWPVEASEEQALARLKALLTPPNLLENTNSFNSLAMTEPPGNERTQNLGSPVCSLDTYRDTRMMSTGADESARLSWALGLGCISPRTVYWETLHSRLQLTGLPGQPLEQTTTTGDEVGWVEPTVDDCGHRWVLMHLGIRDYFIYAAMKAGQDMYESGGPAGRDMPWSTDIVFFKAWAAGRTGFPFVDASMKELAGSGWMTNRGRQNTASFLTKILGIDWRWGAALFAALLTDHDEALNLGNWAYVGGVGYDPRDRKFNTVSQGERYDPEGASIAQWIPELAHLPPNLRHRPWEAQSDGGLEEIKDQGSQGYHPPMVDPATQIGKPPKNKTKKATN